MAWGLLLILEGAAPDLGSRDHSRLKQRLRRRPDVSEAASWCRHRAAVHRLVAHPSALDRLRAVPDVVKTGATAGGAIVDVRRFDAYVRPSLLRRVRRDLALVVVAPGHDANLVLRVPPPGMWPFTDGKAGPATVALDLWDAGDARSRREARLRFARLVAEWDA